MNRKLRMGMIGGGEGAFIGAVHRRAAALDGQIEMVCGAFDVDPAKAKAFGATLYLDPSGATEPIRKCSRRKPRFPWASGWISLPS